MVTTRNVLSERVEIPAKEKIENRNPGLIVGEVHSATETKQKPMPLRLVFSASSYGQIQSNFPEKEIKFFLNSKKLK